MNTFSSELLINLKKQQDDTTQLFSSLSLDNQTFCVMPFVTIILEPDGNVGVCRHKGSKFSFGNIRHQTIDEIWSSKKIQEWRTDFKTGNVVVCSQEVNDRKCNQCPELNKLLPHAEISNIVNPKILRLTANLNGKCNLQCQMCDVWKLPNGFYNEDNFWKPAREKFFKDILEVDLLSGEPFIQSDTYRLISEISSVNEDCSWTFTTNLHWKLTDKIKASLDLIHIKNIILSIDSIDELTYSKIRYPGNLNFVLNNLDHLLEYQNERLMNGRSSLNLRLNCLIQKDNWKEAGKIIQFCFSKKIIPFLTFIYLPEEFSLLTLSNREKIEILNYYFETLSDTELLFMQRITNPLIKSLDKIDYIYFMNLIHEKSK